MSTPPKATKFRIRKIVAPVAAQRSAARDMPFAPDPDDDGFGDMDLVGKKPTQPAPAKTAQPSGAMDENTEMAAIRNEALSARQLRVARRVAFRNGIEAGSDVEAVMLLRRKGIDPFQRSSILEIVKDVTPGNSLVKHQGDAPTPQIIGNLNNPIDSAEVIRAQAIMEMQRDIVRRRRRNFTMLMVRLAFFVFLPTLFAGIYYYKFATPLYATKSEFLVQQAEPTGAGGLGSLFRGTQFATSQDAITVQSFLQSRDAMLKLDTEEGYKTHFSQDFIDPIQRLDKNASNESAYKLYQRNVKIAYDPTEGIIKMEVIAADPASSQRFSEALLRYAESRVDQLTRRVREDQMKGARDSYNNAEEKVQNAQKEVVDLQEKLGILDPKVETSMVMSELTGLQAVLRQKQLQLQQLLDNAKPNQARVEGVKGDIDRLQAQVTELRNSMTEGTSDQFSLAQMSAKLRVVETELQTRQLMLGQALQQLETARIEANRQVRYLTLGVSPVAPDEPTYPRAFENTALAFLIFAGIYMMLSLTASILREQVTS
jgi:capsular polysaccharide transport system permease protein